MYTQCPECQIAFRVTAQVLQKAGGRVRCGGCGNAFSAIEHLSEGPPETVGNTVAEETRLPATEHEQGDDNRALLDTLDQLAGPDPVRLEDTGIEWRLLDEIDEAQPPDESVNNSQASLQLEQAEAPQEASSSDELRYDDDTPLPDDFDVDAAYSPSLEEPQRRSNDLHEQQTDFDTHQVDLALGNDEDWTDLLDADTQTDNEAETEAALARQLEAAEAQQIADDSVILPQLAAAALETDESPTPPNASNQTDDGMDGNGSESDESDAEVPEDIDTQFNLQAEAMGLDITRNEEMVELAESEPPNTEEDLELMLEPGEEIVEENESPVVIDSEEPDEQEETLADGDSAEPDDAIHDEATQAETEGGDDDELSPEEEASIVEKLRESTGAFQKQINAAQLALEKGDIDDYSGHLAEGTTADSSESDAKQKEESRLSQLSKTLTEISSTKRDDSSDPPQDDALSQTMIQAGIDPSLLDENVETIIMEGESISSMGEDEKADAEEGVIADIDQQINLVDTYMLNKDKLRGGRRRSDPAGIGIIAGVILLIVLLAGQFMHASRQTFATYGAFNQTVGPIYRALGQPVTPLWNIKGWQFERTSGNTDENAAALTVLSQIRNGSDSPLPYPLLHVSLTDRWEEVIGSKILEPADYLAGDRDPSKLVAAGDNFKAVIVIERPSPDATGFQLYVCYRIELGRVRCATEDFKN